LNQTGFSRDRFATPPISRTLFEGRHRFFSENKRVNIETVKNLLCKSHEETRETLTLTRAFAPLSLDSSSDCLPSCSLISASNFNSASEGPAAGAATDGAEDDASGIDNDEDDGTDEAEA
jgi:hypothetical protein